LLQTINATRDVTNIQQLFDIWPYCRMLRRYLAKYFEESNFFKVLNNENILEIYFIAFLSKKNQAFT